MIERTTEQASVTLDSGIRVKEVVDMMSGAEYTVALWPDDFYLILPFGGLVYDVPVLEGVLTEERKRFERRPGAPWAAWGWTE